jgi:hypothetical protein
VETVGDVSTMPASWNHRPRALGSGSRSNAAPPRLPRVAVKFTDSLPPCHGNASTMWSAYRCYLLNQ